MSEVYVILENHSDWDASPGMVGYVRDEVRAKSTVDKLKQEHLNIRAFSQKLRELEEKWENENPRPEPQPLRRWPRWPAGAGTKDITDAMREERENIKRENTAIKEQNNVTLQSWMKRRKDATENFWKSALGRPWLIVRESSVSCSYPFLQEGNEYSYIKLDEIC